MFYTYLWFRANGTPYYVGKGSGDRGFTSDGHGVHRPKDRARIFVQYWESEEKAFEMEKWWIALYGRQDNVTGCLRNLTDGGEGASGFSEETIEKMSKAQSLRFSQRGGPFLGKSHTEDSNRRNAEAHRGIKASKETKEKVSKSLLGHEVTEETRKKISASNMGHGFAKETILKMRLAKLGKPLSAEHRAILSKASEHRPSITEETRSRQSAAAKVREKDKHEKRLIKANMTHEQDFVMKVLIHVVKNREYAIAWNKANPDAVKGKNARRYKK